MSYLHKALVSIVALTQLLGCSDSSDNPPATATYSASVTRTEFGIPHIKAEDWGSLGYGYGYAFAQDNVCVLARDVLVATGTQARYFGPGASSANVWCFAPGSGPARSPQPSASTSHWSPSSIST